MVSTIPQLQFQLFSYVHFLGSVSDWTLLTSTNLTALAYNSTQSSTAVGHIQTLEKSLLCMNTTKLLPKQNNPRAGLLELGSPVCASSTHTPIHVATLIPSGLRIVRPARWCNAIARAERSGKPLEWSMHVPSAVAKMSRQLQSER